MFTGASTSSGSNTQQPEEKQEEPFGERPDADATFANVFEEVSFLSETIMVFILMTSSRCSDRRLIVLFQSGLC
jgi:hypothetical protein